MSGKFMNKSIFILDTNIFLQGVSFNLFKGKLYTTPSIIEEIKVKRYHHKNRNILNRIHAAIEGKKLIVQIPSQESLQHVEKISKHTGDMKALSRADKELIALAFDLSKLHGKEKIILLSNDYSMENVSQELAIPYSPLGKRGITKKIKWEVYCPFCKKVYDAEHLEEPCEFCGEKLKRRMKK
ncbi:MAG: PIN domain-containing protein [Promethearchaeia archaeon]